MITIKKRASSSLFNAGVFSCFMRGAIWLKIINSSVSLSIPLSLILPISSYCFGRPALIPLIAILSDRRLVRVKIGMCPSRAISFSRASRTHTRARHGPPSPLSMHTIKLIDVRLTCRYRLVSVDRRSIGYKWESFATHATRLTIPRASRNSNASPRVSR